MSKENSKEAMPESTGKAEGTAKPKPVEAVAESAAENKQIKNWPFWVTELGADYPLARGACASLKADWDSEIGEKQFTEALEKFGGQTFGAHKPKGDKK